ncbi:MAG: hypothetical protein JWR80_5503 [Bradyrhizobium sp.]|nr:hypothetical protein [Bradyrhizobium sp.]
MSQATWYLNKAAECGRLAAETADRAVRAERLSDQKHWIIIAKGIETAEAAVKLRRTD